MPERFAYSNALSDVHPAEKLAFSVSCMAAALLGVSMAVHIAVIVIMASAALFIAKIPLRHYLRAMCSALIFIAIGCAAAAYGAMDLRGAVFIFLRAFAAATCFYFLIFTTAVADILAFLRKMRVPQVLLELMGLTYRFIFVFMDIAHKTQTAQSSRLGYGGLRNSYRSMGILISGLFSRTFRNADTLHTALLSRGLQEEIRVMQRVFKHSACNIAAVAAVDCLLAALSI
ncbi:MAG: cobalt ECF transporter T component CbiQ, partial [Candidatus Magnetominusculus sp. LBB02]|nr:cobalt ECF transporter T component CbiQ [Candidatus Magnetominusculus sp. LBB02]